MHFLPVPNQLHAYASKVTYKSTYNRTMCDSEESLSPTTIGDEITTLYPIHFLYRCVFFLLLIGEIRFGLSECDFGYVTVQDDVSSGSVCVDNFEDNDNGCGVLCRDLNYT